MIKSTLVQDVAFGKGAWLAVGLRNPRVGARPLNLNDEDSRASRLNFPRGLYGASNFHMLRELSTEVDAVVRVVYVARSQHRETGRANLPSGSRPSR